jgi:hypothetical protein
VHAVQWPRKPVVGVKSPSSNRSLVLEGKVVDGISFIAEKLAEKRKTKCVPMAENHRLV